MTKKKRNSSVSAYDADTEALARGLEERTVWRRQGVEITGRHIDPEALAADQIRAEYQSRLWHRYDWAQWLQPPELSDMLKVAAEDARKRMPDAPHEQIIVQGLLVLHDYIYNNAQTIAPALFAAFDLPVPNIFNVAPADRPVEVPFRNLVALGLERGPNYWPQRQARLKRWRAWCELAFAIVWAQWPTYANNGDVFSRMLLPHDVFLQKDGTWSFVSVDHQRLLDAIAQYDTDPVGARAHATWIRRSDLLDHPELFAWPAVTVVWNDLQLCDRFSLTTLVVKALERRQLQRKLTREACEESCKDKWRTPQYRRCVDRCLVKHEDDEPDPYIELKLVK